MKKILLIVGMILCVGVIGSVFAVSVYNATSTETVTAQDYIYLTFDGTAEVDVVLTKGEKYVYNVYLTVDSNNENCSGTFSVVCEDEESPSTKSLTDVTVTVCSDPAGNTAVTGANVTTSGKNTTISGITTNTNYYIAILLDGEADATQVTNCGGKMTLSFNAVIPE